MRILIHDYSGHPPQIAISRELSRRGHDVLYLYAKGNRTPRGAVERRSSDPISFRIDGVDIGQSLVKQNYAKRQLQEIKYGNALVKVATGFHPELVVCSDTPHFPLNRLRRSCRRINVPFVLWMMDVKGVSIRNWLVRRVPLLGKTVGAFFIEFEKYIVRRCDHVIAISDDFREVTQRWGISRERLDVVPLWAPLNEIPVRPKNNAWARRYGLSCTKNLIYAGTLGNSHSPSHFVKMAKGLAHRADVRVVVVTEGPSASYLMSRKERDDLENLLVLPYQPYEDLPSLFGAADVLLVVLNDSAATHSVPGKVLSHLCAGKPQLAVMPSNNHAAQVIRDSGGGVVVPSDDPSTILSTAEGLLDDVETRKRMERNARAYAENEFDIRRIGDRFEAVIMKAYADRGSAQTR